MSEADGSTDQGVVNRWIEAKSKYRKKLIQKVFVPLCSMNVGGYELCRKYLDSVRGRRAGPRTKYLMSLAPRLMRSA